MNEESYSNTDFIDMESDYNENVKYPFCTNESDSEPKPTPLRDL